MKAENSKNIDRLFKEKLTDREHTINLEPVVIFQYGLKKHRKKQAYFYWLSSIVIFILIGGAVLWQIRFFNEKHKDEVSLHQTENTDHESVSTKTAFLPVKNNNTECHRIDRTSPENAAITNQQSDLLGSPKENRRFSEESKVNEGSKNYQDINSGNETPAYIQSLASTKYNLNKKEETKVTIHAINGNINTPHAEYAPVINADGTAMYFTSSRPIDDKAKKKKDKPREMIYYTSFDKNKKQWITPELLPAPINQPERFNSAVAISNDGQQLFVYQDDRFGNGDIYTTRLQGNTWTPLEKLPEPINSKYIEATVSLSPDGKMIYYTSNRPGGYGGMDIWYSVKNKEGTWGETINLGSKINTEKDEEGVFIHPDGKTLYFSSRGHKGLGGYDIFYAVLENTKWTTPVNLGAEINSPNDDVYFVIDAAKKNAYYASVRPDGQGEKDIYKVEFTEPEEENTEPEEENNNNPTLTLFKGIVLDKTNEKPLEATIEIIDLDQDEQVTELNSNASTGSFMLSLPTGKNYAININKKGYLFYSESFMLDVSNKYNEVEKIIKLDKLVSGAKVVLNNIFYDYNKATLREQSKTELNKVYELMVQNPELKIELSAHTDSRGIDIYNLNLSQQRAQSCLNYLMDKGLLKDRLIAKGYGKQQLIASDEQINNMSSESEKEDAHQQNRRTEIKIIEN